MHNAKNKRRYIYDLKNWEMLIWTKSICFWFLIQKRDQRFYLNIVFVFCSSLARVVILLKISLSEKENIAIQYQKYTELICFF